MLELQEVPKGIPGTAPCDLPFYYYSNFWGTGKAHSITFWEHH